jgi:hypothetical protein
MMTIEKLHINRFSKDYGTGLSSVHQIYALAVVLYSKLYFSVESGAPIYMYRTL